MSGETKSPMIATLRHRDFALLWSGQALSSVGNQMFPIILAIVVLQRGSGAGGLGLVLAVQGIALAVGTTMAAAVTDRWPRTRIMISTDVVRVVGVMAIAISPAALPDPAFLVLVIVIGLAEGMFLPAYTAVTPRLLPEEALQGGNAISALSMYVAMVLGPVLAGVVLAGFGAGPALWVDVGTFGASLVTLLLIREIGTADAGAGDAAPVGGFLRQSLRDFTEGLRAVRDRPWVGMSILMATIVMTFVVAPAFLAAPIVAADRLGGPEAYGSMFTALGIGSILGSILGGKIRTRRPGLVAVAGIFTIFASVGSLATLPLAGILLGWGLAGVGVTIFQIMWTTALQKDVPDHLLGRVMALDWLGSQGLMPLGYALAGVVVAATGTDSMLIGCAFLVLVTAPLPLLVRGGTTFSSGEPNPRPAATAEPAESEV